MGSSPTASFRRGGHFSSASFRGGLPAACALTHAVHRLLMYICRMQRQCLPGTFLMQLTTNSAWVAISGSCRHTCHIRPSNRRSGTVAVEMLHAVKPELHAILSSGAW
jgi:hypothetical protein